MDMPKEPKVVVDLLMPTTLISTSSTKILIIAFIYFLRLLLMGLCCALRSRSIPSLVNVALTSQFEIGRSSATVSNPVGEATAFFIGFDQAKTNDLNLVDLLRRRISLC